MSETLVQEVEGAVAPVVTAAETAAKTVVSATAPSIISRIVTGIEKGAETLWSTAEPDIDSDVAKIKAVLPAAIQPAFTAAVADVKQGASDALTIGAGLVAAGAPAAITTVESAADALFAAYAGAAAPALDLATADAIQAVSAPLIAALQAWTLKKQAAAAEAVAA